MKWVIDDEKIRRDHSEQHIINAPTEIKTDKQNSRYGFTAFIVFIAILLLLFRSC
jgi:hypothetical protein